MLVSAHATVCCSRCGHAVDHESWRRLRLAQRLEAAQLAHIVLDWPATVCVEVRSCLRCGTPIARRAQARLAASGV
jgi:hypothetical protein